MAKSTRASGEFGEWRAEGKAPAIRYALRVMEEIRAAAVEGYRSLPRTGMEVGGVLFGYREGDTVTVTAARPIECEHAMGPAFVLSKRDQAGLSALLAEARRDPPFGGAEPVGWYHSHTRTDVLLSQEDLEIFGRYFPERWQVALVLRPQKFGPSQAGFFIREEDGSVRAEASYREFTLEPYKSAGETRPSPPREDPEPAVPPALPAERPAGGAWKYAFFAVSLALIAILAAIAGRDYVRIGPQPAALSLRAIDVNGELVIAWDRLAQPVREAESGVLEIREGAGKTRLPLDRDHLAAAGATYARQSGTVEVRMITYAKGRTLAREAVSFAGPANARSEAGRIDELVRQRDQAVRERDLAHKQANALRDQVRAEAQKRNDLESAVRALRQRLAVETTLRRR